MALAVTALASGADEDTSSSATSASISPSGNALVVCDVLNLNNDFSSPPNTPTVSGNGLTWVQVATVTYVDFGGGPLVRLTRFRAMGASPSSGTVTITCSAAQAIIAYSIYEITGVDTSGTNGSGAVVQTTADTAAIATALTVSLAAFGSPNNMAIGAFGFGLDSGSFTAGSGFTTIHDIAASGPDIVFTEYKLNDTTVDITRDYAQDLAGIASEIKEAVSAKAPPPFRKPSRYYTRRRAV